MDRHLGPARLRLAPASPAKAFFAHSPGNLCDCDYVPPGICFRTIRLRRRRLVWVIIPLLVLGRRPTVSVYLWNRII